MDTQDIFEALAARYDTPQREALARVIAREVEGALPHGGGLPRGGKLRGLDYGCGTGLVGLRLAGRFESLLLADAAHRMVELVQDKIERGGLSNARAMQADFCREAVPEGLEFDVVLLCQVLLHVPDYEPLLARLGDALAPGGRLIIVDFDKNEAVPSDRVHNGFVQAQLAARLEGLGFASATSRTFHHGQGIFMGRDAALFLLQADRPDGGRQ